MQNRRLRALTAATAALVVGALLAAPTQGALAAEPTVTPESHHMLTVFRVATDSEQDRQKLASGFDLMDKRTGDDMFVLGDDSDRTRLVEQGFAPTVDSTMSAPRYAPARSADDPAATNVDDTFYGGYHTVNGRYAHLDEVAKQHPNLTSLHTYGESWRKQTGAGNGYDLRAICVTNKQEGDCELKPDSKKPRFFLLGQLHARELATGETAERWIDHLVTQYGKNERVTKLMDTTEMWVVPVGNPDGVDIVQQGGDNPLMQRKNANNSVQECGEPNNGVDLNRNADTHWGESGSSTDPCGETYQGPSAGSEPENKALFDLMKQLYPDKREGGDEAPAAQDARGMFISLHSVAGMVLFPWNHNANIHTGNDAALRKHGDEMGRLTDYQSGQAGEILYDASGGTDDWAYDKLGLASYTIEVGDYAGECGGFMPAYQCNEQTIFPALLPALMYAGENSAAPYQELIAPGPVTQTR